MTTGGVCKQKNGHHGERLQCNKNVNAVNERIRYQFPINVVYIYRSSNVGSTENMANINNVVDIKNMNRPSFAPTWIFVVF